MEREASKLKQHANNSLVIQVMIQRKMHVLERSSNNFLSLALMILVMILMMTESTVTAIRRKHLFQSQKGRGTLEFSLILMMQMLMNLIHLMMKESESIIQR